MKLRLPHPDLVLRSFAFAVLGGIAASGLLSVVWGVDLADWLHWGPDCVFRAWTAWTCPGCGMAHALVRTGQGQFAEAFAANPASPLMVAWIALSALRPAWLGALK